MSCNYSEIADTVEGWIASLEIFAKYLSKGMQSVGFLEPVHDMIYVDVHEDDLPEDSEDGQALKELGWHVSSDLGTWATFT